MPSRRRTQPSRAVAIFWIVAVFVAGTFTASLGSRAAHAEEPTASEPGPDPTLPPTDGGCSEFGSVGPLPTGDLSISGVVTAGGSPRGDITVFIREASGGLVDTATNPAGQYAFTGLGDGSYKISFFDPTAVYRSGFYAGPATPPALSADAAQVILIAGSSATNINASLDPESLHVISGSVDDHDGAPVTTAELRADGAYFPLVGCAANTTGTFAMEDVRTGIYRIQVDAPGFPRGYYRSGVPGNFTTHATEATLVTVDGDVSGIEIDFPQLYSLMGSVQDGTTGFADFYISASEIVPGASGEAASELGGGFTIDGLPEGEYRIHYADGNNVYRSGWYAGNGAISPTEAGAATVIVPGPAIELLAELAPTISGRITNEDGDGIPPSLNICDEFDLVCAAVTFTDDQGYYTAAALEPATYYVKVYGDQTLYPYGGYIGTDAEGTVVHDFADALAIPVTTTNVESVDGKLPFGGRIEAQLTSAGAHIDFPQVQFCVGDGMCGDGAIEYDSEFDALSAAYFDGQTLYAFYDVDYDGVGVWLVDGGTASSDFGDATSIVISAGNTVVIGSDIPESGEPTTPEDPNITLDDGSGNPIDMSFAGIDEGEGGVTNVTTSDGGPAAPDGFQLGVPATYYDFTTTAIFDSVQICITYEGVSYISEANLRLFHYNEGTLIWDDITDDGYPDLDAHRICGTTNSLSPFVLAEQSYSFTGFHGPKAPTTFNAAKAGDPIGLTFGLGGDFGLLIFAAGWPEVHQISCTTGEPIGAADATTSSLKYSDKKDLYTLQISTAKAWKNTCRSISFELLDGTFATVWYRLRA